MAECNEHPGLLPDGRGTGTGLDVRVTKRKMLKKCQPGPRVLQGCGAHGLLLLEIQPLLWSWNEQQLSSRMSPSLSSSLLPWRRLPDPPRTREVGLTQPLCRGAHVSWPRSGDIITAPSSDFPSPAHPPC